MSYNESSSTRAYARVATPGADALVHDLNNVLTGIAGSIDVVLGELHPAADAAVPLRDALAGVYRAADLLRRLQGETIAEAGMFALAPLVAETARLARGCRAASAVALAAIPGAAHVRGDATEFQRALLNVLLNALEASPPGSPVQIAYFRDGGMHQLEVRDEGEGIPAEIRDRVFEPFFTTRSAGTGLGLASARAAVQALGGELSLVPGGRGATFAVRVPAAEAA